MSSTALPHRVVRERQAFLSQVARVPGRRQWAWLLAGLTLAFGVPFLFADVWPVDRDVYYGLHVGVVFNPLGLRHTSYEPGPSLLAPYAHGYVLPQTFGTNFFPPSKAPIDATRLTLGLAGASSIVASAEDVARFYSALLSGRLLHPRTLDVLMLPERMGIGAVPTTCGVGYGHNGAFFTYTAAVRASGDGRTAAVLLMNGRGPQADSRLESGVATLFCELR